MKVFISGAQGFSVSVLTSKGRANRAYRDFFLINTRVVLTMDSFRVYRIMKKGVTWAFVCVYLKWNVY